MAGPGTTFAGPVISGSKKDADANGAANTGLCVLSQVLGPITPNGSSDASASVAIPAGSQILDVIVDTTTAFNAGTSATLTVGTAAADSSYASGVSVQATGRARPTFTAAQLGNMLDVGANTGVVATVAPVGTAPTAGSVTVTLVYIQTVQLSAGVA